MKNLLFFPSFFALFTGCADSGVDLLSELPSDSVLHSYLEYTSVQKDFPETLKAHRGWHLVLQHGGCASAACKDGVLCIDVADGGSQWYSVQVCLLPIPVKEGRYKVVFEARSDKPRAMILDVSHVGGDWYSFSGRVPYQLTPNWKAYAAEFAVNGRVDPLARFEFNLGGECVGAEFRNVRIIHKPL